MSLAGLSDTYYRTQAATASLTAGGLAKLWQSVSLDDLDGTWAQQLQAMANTIALGQLRAAAAAPMYLSRVLALDGIRPSPIGEIPTTAFTGLTAAGLELSQVLGSVPIRVKQQLTAGAGPELALNSGRARLTMIGRTEVADAGRGAMEASLMLEPAIVGYERRVRAGACDRCQAQAGKFFKVNAGFKRHPGCDCTHEPVTRKRQRGRTPEPAVAGLDGMARPGAAYKPPVGGCRC